MVNCFANNFWDEEFNGTEGYDHLVMRLKDGKKLYDAFSDFVRNRAKVEDDYGKSLIKLAQTEAGNDETGSLKISWEAIKKETENIGQIHCELSKQLNELSERCLSFREKQKNERIKIDEPMRKEQKEKKASHDSMLKARRFYEQRCKEYEVAREAYEAKSSYTPKEEEKLKRNKQKSKTAVETADSLYQSSVKQLEELRQKYILNMEDACIRFQTIEEGRIRFLRSEMWLYTNHGSTQVINVDQKYEQCRMSLEKCSVKLDIQLFINLKHTGSIRPSTIEYINYYHNIKASTDFSTNIDTNISINPNAMSTEKSSSHPNLLGNSGHHEHLTSNPNQLSYIGQHLHSSSNPNLLSHHETSQRVKQVDDTYASVSPNRTPKRARAAFAYQSQSSQELSLNPGDLIQIKNFVDETWAIGVLGGKTGAFPLTFVDIL